MTPRPIVRFCIEYRAVLVDLKPPRCAACLGAYTILAEFQWLELVDRLTFLRLFLANYPNYRLAHRRRTYTRSDRKPFRAIRGYDERTRRAISIPV